MRRETQSQTQEGTKKELEAKGISTEPSEDLDSGQVQAKGRIPAVEGWLCLCAEPASGGSCEVIRPLYEISEHPGFFRLRATLDNREVHSGIFAYLDDQKAFEIAEEIARKLSVEDEGGVWVVRQVLRIWDEFAKVPNARKEEAVKYASYLLFQLGFSEETALYELGRWNDYYGTHLPEGELQRCIPEAQNKHEEALRKGKVTRAWEVFKPR
jgi:hypothetical protein